MRLDEDDADADESDTCAAAEKRTKSRRKMKCARTVRRVIIILTPHLIIWS